MPDLRLVASLGRQARDSWVAALATAHVVFAWFAPSWVAPLVLLWAGLFAWRADIRSAWTPRALLAATGLLAFLALKDLALPGPFAAELARLDPASAPTRFRQPDWPVWLVSFGRIAALLLALPALRGLLASERRARAAAAGLALAVAGLACLLLTHPEEIAAYGKTFQIGEVASRNPAAGVFALGALLAFGCGLSAWRTGRRSSLLFFASALPPAAAVLALGSRGGVLALGAGAAFLLYQENRYKLGRVAGLLGGLVVLLLLFAPGPLARLAAEGETYRAELAAASVRALAHAPWGGLGLGGFAPGFALFGGHMPAEGMRVIHPDCGWVLLLVEWGPLGLLALALAATALLRGASPADDGAPRLAAGAGLVAWAVAAVGDASFHRTELLVLALPLLALRFPPTEAENEPRAAPRLAPVFVTGLALAALAACLQGEARVRAARDPAKSDERLAAALPLDPAVRHLAGNRAFERGDLPRAAAEYTIAAALDPANTVAIQAYARALSDARPDLSLPLWRRLFSGATLRVEGLVAEELARPGARDASFWFRALSDLPALWAMPADTDLRGAQAAYEQWRRLAAPARAASPWRSVLGASARWGTARQFTDWLRDAAPARQPAAAMKGAEILRRRSRDDLAWLWLAYQLPAPPPAAPRPADPSLTAIVLANPDDAVAASRLLDQTGSPEERIALLRRFVARPKIPAAFRVRLAHELDAAGRRPEALATLASAADELARGN